MRPNQTLETFPDGSLEVYEEDNRTIGLLKAKLRYEDKTVGIKRYYEAKNSIKGYTIALVLKVHHTGLVSEMDIVVINDRQYRVRKIQYIPERGVDLLELESVKVKVRE